jgi:MYXO-CTERM domain-containing protein
MKTSRICAGVVATLALFAGDYAHADPVATGPTVILNTYSKVWVVGDTLGPVQNGTPRLSQKTGAGTMDAHFAFDASNPASVVLATVYTRSALTPNNNNSYEQGGVAIATLTEKGVTPGVTVDLPVNQGDRPFMRPTIEMTSKYVFVQGADDGSNGVNNNPQPIAYLLDKSTGALVKITNNTQGNNINKGTNLIQQALKDGIQVNNPNNQRGIHSIVKTGPNTFAMGMQYNNQAAEVIGVTVGDDASIHVNYLKRFSNTAQHCRPQVALLPGTTDAVMTSVEANNQPAEIGARLTRFNALTGATVKSTIIVRSDPKANKYVAEPSIGIVGDKIALGYSLSASVNRQRNGENGHAGGSQIAMLNLVDATALTIVGAPLMNAAAYGRHAGIFATTYGPEAAPAIAYIGGSSTGTKGAFEQLIPLKADGTLGLKDPAKLYAVSAYSDVANVQARGKRNPNNQARGFINGLGAVPNPGFGKTATGFMPEVKSFSFSTITGYTDAAAATVGKRNSIWLSLVPASWAAGINTTPGAPTEKPGTNPDGTGPSPTTTGPGTNPSGDSADNGTNVLGGTDPTNPDADGSRAQLGGDNGGCSVSSNSTSSSGAGFILLAVAGVILALRRKNEEV